MLFITIIVIYNNIAVVKNIHLNIDLCCYRFQQSAELNLQIGTLSHSESELLETNSRLRESLERVREDLRSVRTQTERTQQEAERYAKLFLRCPSRVQI